MQFRPCIDIHNGKVKQIIGSTLTDSENRPHENFVSEQGADYYAALYKRDRLAGGHIIMLGPGNREQALKALQAYPGGMQIGGGISYDNASFFLEKGASHVIVTSSVFRDGMIDFANLERIVREAGKERLVLDLSCRKQGEKYFVVTDRWQKFTDFQLTKRNLEQLAGHCDEFLIHAADVEGKCNGIQRDVVILLGEWATIPVTYAGGVCSIPDLEEIERLGNSNVNVTIGSALDIFGGNLSYKEVVQWFNIKHERSL